MTLPGMESAGGPPAPPLVQAARAHIEHLRRQTTADGQPLVRPEHELLIALVMHLVRAVSMTTKAYALANLSKELREALAELPGSEAGDPWDELMKHLHRLQDTPPAEREPERG